MKEQREKERRANSQPCLVAGIWKVLEEFLYLGGRNMEGSGRVSLPWWQEYGRFWTSRAPGVENCSLKFGHRKLEEKSTNIPFQYIFYPVISVPGDRKALSFILNNNNTSENCTVVCKKVFFLAENIIQSKVMEVRR